MSGKIKKIIICSLITVLLVSPIIVFSVMYKSNKRVNKFDPAKAEIEIVESTAQQETAGDELHNEYTLAKNAGDDNYSVQKPVRILDKRSNTGEELRVCFIPMWYSDDNVCGGIDGVTDISDITLDAAGNKLIYYTGTGDDKAATVTLYLASGYEKNWEYKSDGCFYYSGSISSDKTTPPLIERLEVTKAVYEATDGYTLRLDVLADALQKSGNAYSNRDWDEYEPTP